MPYDDPERDLYNGKPARERLLVPFVVSLCAGLLVHFSLYSAGLMNPDAIWKGSHSASGVWEASLGRWGLYFYELLRGGINSPPLSAFLAVLFSAATGALLADLFGITNRVRSSIAAALIACSPMVAMFITYPYCGDAYAFSFLLAALSVFAVFRVPNRIVGAASGGLCLAFSLGLYQPAVGAALAAGAGSLLVRLLRGPERTKSILAEAARLLASFTVGLVLYAALASIALTAWDVSLAEYKGVTTAAPLSVLWSLGRGVAKAYTTFTGFFFSDWLARNAYGEIYAYIALAACALSVLCIRFARMRQYPAAIAASLILVVTFPLCCNAIQLALTQADIYLLMASGMMVTLPLAVAVTGLNGEGRSMIAGHIINGLSCVAAGILLWSFVLAGQTDAIVMRVGQNQAVQLAARFWERVETHESYRPWETPIFIAGRPQDGNYPNPSELFDKANVYAKWGVVWQTYQGNYFVWSRFLQGNLGIIYNKCPVDRFIPIARSEAFRAMPLFPAEGSVRMLEGVLVVKISDTDGWE